MLPEVLKLIQQSGDKAVTVESLLGGISAESTPPEKASSHLEQALAEGRRLGLVSVQRNRIKLLVPLENPQDSLNFASQLLLLTSDAPGLKIENVEGVEQATDGQMLPPRTFPRLPEKQLRAGYVPSELDPVRNVRHRMTVSGITQAAAGAQRGGRTRSSARKRSRSRRNRSSSRSRSRSRSNRRRGRRSRSRR
ncbi:uncharacterized protein LOC110678743 [Aedes aegypti]|uniref:Uncharacterized protein n=1 Tax=Aedes aegypti TaxID=7159 RepID=A0A6I8TQA1_AEDAE|nr:uncharacterized protein LOC110678743 [Aedes aegypti]